MDVITGWKVGPHSASICAVTSVTRIIYQEVGVSWPAHHHWAHRFCLFLPLLRWCNEHFSDENPIFHLFLDDRFSIIINQWCDFLSQNAFLQLGIAFIVLDFFCQRLYAHQRYVLSICINLELTLLYPKPLKIFSLWEWKTVNYPVMMCFSPEHSIAN